MTNKYHVRLTMVVDADDPERAVSEFAMNLAEFGTLNWVFFVENLDTGEVRYVNRGGDDLDEATLLYMQQTIEAHKAAWQQRNQSVVDIDASASVVHATGDSSSEGEGLENLAQTLLDEQRAQE